MSTVYTNPTQDRFYQIPQGADIAGGGLVLRSLRGETLSVDAGAAAAFEVDEATAKLLVKGEVKAFTKNAATAFSTLGDVLRAASHKSATKTSADRVSPSDVLAKALGVTSDQLRNDPSAVKMGLSSVLQGLARAVQEATSDTPEDKERTEARMRAVASALGAETPDTSVVRESMEKLSASLSDPALSAKIRDASSKIEEATANLHSEGAGVDVELDSASQEPS